MTPKYYTKKGLELKQEQIRAQQEKVRAVGKEAGDEAGMNCDWHDNFGYEDAKRRLELESEVLRQLLEETQGAQIIQVEEQNNRITIGVSARIIVNGEEREMTIGAFGESNPEKKLVSYVSPVGRVLLGMRVGDSRTVNLAGRAARIEVLEILPPSYRYNQLLPDLS